MVAWLEREGLSVLCSIAREHGVNDPCLFALYEVCLDGATFMGDCAALGITASAMQIKLKGRLAILFGSGN